MSSDTHNEKLLQEVNQKLKDAYKAEEEYWKQRSRTLWLALGDKNSGYFHATTRGRRAVNKFSTIEDSEGQAVFEEPEIVEVITSYFQDLFVTKSSNCTETVAQALQPCVSIAENDRLIADPTPAEIKAALFSIHPDKAPGLDGFPASFFQNNWETVGKKITEEIKEIFASGIIPRSINSTHVRLIPKILNPKAVSDYRPIALCNVYYKIMSKILTHRLQALLPEIITETQSAFVTNRAIADNVLITHETLHYLKTSGATKHCSMAVKTDMSKAYDILEWGFIAEIWVPPKMDQLDPTMSHYCLLLLPDKWSGTRTGSAPARHPARGPLITLHLYTLWRSTLRLMQKRPRERHLPGNSSRKKEP